MLSNEDANKLFSGSTDLLKLKLIAAAIFALFFSTCENEIYSNQKHWLDLGQMMLTWLQIWAWQTPPNNKQSQRK